MCEADKAANPIWNPGFSSICHELRGPLTAMLAHAERLGHCDLDENQRAEQLQGLQAHTEAVLRFIHDELGRRSEACQQAAAELRNLTSHCGSAALIREFVSEMPSRLAELQTFWSGRDYSGVARGAHRLKGAASMYGFADLSETADLLEAAILEAQNADLIEELLTELGDLIDRATGNPTGDALAATSAKP